MQAAWKEITASTCYLSGLSQYHDAGHVSTTVFCITQQKFRIQLTEYTNHGIRQLCFFSWLSKRSVPFCVQT